VTTSAQPGTVWPPGSGSNQRAKRGSPGRAPTETARYAHTFNRKLVVAAWGGAGHAYRVIVYPAAPLGIHPGQTIAVIGWNECASVQFRAATRHSTYWALAG
jgi:hypothetical protein